MTDAAPDFDSFLQTRIAASEAWCRGDPAPLVALSADAGTATFFDPGGGVTTGAGAVLDAYRAGARGFGPSTVTTIEILDSGASDGIGFWTGYQHADAELTGTPGRVTMKLRITEVFRREPEGWTLVHRHASMPKDG